MPRVPSNQLQYSYSSYDARTTSANATTHGIPSDLISNQPLKSGTSTTPSRGLRPHPPNSTPRAQFYTKTHYRSPTIPHNQFLSNHKPAQLPPRPLPHLIHCEAARRSSVSNLSSAPRNGHARARDAHNSLHAPAERTSHTPTKLAPQPHPALQGAYTISRPLPIPRPPARTHEQTNGSSDYKPRSTQK